MSITANLKKNLIKKARLSELILISGIFAFTAALVLGLFPNTDTPEGKESEYFILLLMIIPVIAASYFISISFIRKLSVNISDRSSSIVFKYMLAFISVAILPSLAIIIISNHIINATISDLITDETVHALKESVNLSNDYIQNIYQDIDGELKSLDYSLENGILDPNSAVDRMQFVNTSAIKGLSCAIYKIKEKNPLENKISLLVDKNKNKNYSDGITKYFQNVDLDLMLRISNISIGKTSVLIGQSSHKGFIFTVNKDIPGIIYNRLAVYNDSLKRYGKREFYKPYFQTGVGILLLSIVILIVIISISVSFFLSRGISRPVLQLAEAAEHVAAGNFQISLTRDSYDEVALLFKSFNKMVKQLDESRKVMYHAQRLEAWRDVARRLVHEIKNPLTPIRLSAERIQNRFKEGHPDIGNIISSGTETIIEEVKVLSRIFDEFSRFARLPEMHGEYQNINPLIENCVNFFLGNESISFHLELEKSIPRLFIDKILIRQALTNLIQNSVDAVGGKGNIYVKSSFADTDRKIVNISIRDDGQGIEAENLLNVFDPTFSTKETGTGLGLAIVEKIILEHKGKIICNSKKGEGTEFIIELPVL
jgi:two-component system, NtrC family, nitrogen regulation sensor histidine kinase NtrY